jgi:hypothetical protein
MTTSLKFVHTEYGKTRTKLYKLIIINDICVGISSKRRSQSLLQLLNVPFLHFLHFLNFEYQQIALVIHDRN